MELDTTQEMKRPEVHFNGCQSCGGNLFRRYDIDLSPWECAGCGQQTGA